MLAEVGSILEADTQQVAMYPEKCNTICCLYASATIVIHRDQLQRLLSQHDRARHEAHKFGETQKEQTQGHCPAML